MINDCILNSEEIDSNKLEFAIRATAGSSNYRNDRERPYTGQPQTLHGKRGETEVSGLTMRDISDCILQGFLSASGVSGLARKTFPLSSDDVRYTKGDWRYDDVYLIPPDYDPQAVIQMAMCFVEKYMGIFPNIGTLSYRDIIEE